MNASTLCTATSQCSASSVRSREESSTVPEPNTRRLGNPEACRAA